MSRLDKGMSLADPFLAPICGAMTQGKGSVPLAGALPQRKIRANQGDGR